MTDKPNVTDADRKAYMRMNADLLPKYREAILAGEWDRAPSIQAFARHRIATERETEARIVTAIRATMCDCSGKFIADAIERGEHRHDH